MTLSSSEPLFCLTHVVNEPSNHGHIRRLTVWGFPCSHKLSEMWPSNDGCIRRVAVWGFPYSSYQLPPPTTTSCYHVILPCIYHLWWKTFAVSRLYLHSTKNVHSYQLLQAFIVFTCKSLPKNFCSCEAIHEKCESFSLWIISNIRYWECDHPTMVISED